MCKSPGALKIEASGDFFIARDVIVMLDFVIVQLYGRYATTGL